MSLGKIFTKIKSQSGRTMTEILGVIAIIGVLSLTGLLGYNYAMEVVRENETLNRAAKIIAGARTSYILQNLGDATAFYQPDEDLPSGVQVGDRRDKFEPQSINMHDVISNIGNDFAPDATYILAPLKGPFKDGTEQNVRIYVRVETPDAFTVRFDNLTKQACMKIVTAQNLGYWWAYEDAQGMTHTLDPTDSMNEEKAEELCDRVVGLEPQKNASARDLFLNNPFVKQAVAKDPARSGTLVLWFGPFTPSPGDEGEYPLCAGEGCCCEIAEDGKVYPVGKAGCKKPPYGSCLPCTYENSEGKCVQKDGVTCPADDVCHVSKCKSYQFECGNTCCAKGQTCENGVCKGAPEEGLCLEGQTQCGDNCCEADEICNTDGECVADPCPKSEGKFWCIQDEVCCAANEKCQNGECIKACPSGQASCGEDCCPEGHECKESCGYFYCVPKCGAGETLYCSHDTDFVGDGKSGQTSGDNKYLCEIYHSCCDEWQCTDASLILKDPNTPPRQREVPINKKGKYDYCALVLNNKCALMTYCDEKPVSTDDSLLQICPTCFENDWTSKDFNPTNQICIGDTLHDIDTLTDGDDTLMMFRCDGATVPPLGPPLPPCTDACPEGEIPAAGGKCCPEGNGWGACGHCSTWPTYTDNCGRTYPVADICCPGQTSAPPGCTGLGNGQCYANYPINNRTQCCAYACADENGGETCCSPADASHGICCDNPEPSTQTCCDFKGRTWCAPTNGKGNGQCCKDNEECVDGECKADKTCEDAGGIMMGEGVTIPDASQVKDKDGNPIEGCCIKKCACPDECCDADVKHCLKK